MKLHNELLNTLVTATLNNKITWVRSSPSSFTACAYGTYFVFACDERNHAREPQLSVAEQDISEGVPPSTVLNTFEQPLDLSPLHTAIERQTQLSQPKLNGFLQRTIRLLND